MQSPGNLGWRTRMFDFLIGLGVGLVAAWGGVSFAVAKGWYMAAERRAEIAKKAAAESWDKGTV